MSDCFGFPQTCKPPTPFELQVINLLCQLSKYEADALDSEIVLLCDSANNDAPVIARYRFTVQNSVQTQILTDAWNIDGTAYAGSLTTLVSCGGGTFTVNSSVLAEYFICDNGTQKIVQLCGTTCGNLEVSYLLLNRTVSTTPGDWTLVTLGDCLATKGRQHTAITSSTGETTIVTADASHHLDIYSLLITNTSDTDCAVTIKQATAGATAWVIEIPTHETRGFTLPMESAALQATTNANWTATCAASLASIYITALFILRN